MQYKGINHQKHLQKATQFKGFFRAHDLQWFEDHGHHTMHIHDTAYE